MITDGYGKLKELRDPTTSDVDVGHFNLPKRQTTRRRHTLYARIHKHTHIIHVSTYTTIHVYKSTNIHVYKQLYSATVFLCGAGAYMYMYI